MASKRMDLHKRCLFVLSGVSNALGRCMAIEMCRRFKPGSVALLIDTVEEDLQAVKKEIRFLERGVDVICCATTLGQRTDVGVFREVLASTLASLDADKCNFELVFMLHNEGSGATSKLMEPQDARSWETYMQEHLYMPAALNQALLQTDDLQGVAKLIVNVTSSLPVKPFLYHSATGSCKKARDMYFRAMAAEEGRNSVAVVSYAPGILESHAPEFDMNNNMVELCDLGIAEKLLELPRVLPLQSTLKLINILEEMSFISGHDVDYYDTYFL